jgi:cytidylate kinase
LGDEVAQALAEHLHWQVFDREFVDCIARDSHVRQDLVDELDEKSQSLIQDTVQRLLHAVEGISFGNQEYHESLLRTLAILAARGNVVIVGRGGAYALQGEPGFHVRIFSSPEMRVVRLAECWATSIEDARRRMEKIDAERRNFRHHHFGHHVEDSSFFNMILNSDQLSIDQMVSVLGQIVESVARPHASKLADAAPWKSEPRATESASVIARTS